jgi:hypothetical protein
MNTLAIMCLWVSALAAGHQALAFDDNTPCREVAAVMDVEPVDPRAVSELNTYLFRALNDLDRASVAKEEPAVPAPMSKVRRMKFAALAIGYCRKSQGETLGAEIRSAYDGFRTIQQSSGQ